MPRCRPREAAAAAASVLSAVGGRRHTLGGTIRQRLADGQDETARSVALGRGMSAEYAKLAPKEESIEFGGAAPEESAEYTVNWETEKDDALARKYPFQRIVFLWPLPPCDACLLK